MESRIFTSRMCYNLNDSNYCSICPKTIYLGCSRKRNWKVYLYFEVDSIPSEAIIDEACLCFYEMNSSVHNQNDEYQLAIIPASDYLNPCCCDYQEIPQEPNWQLFYELTSIHNILKINIKALVETWVARIIPNYGCFVELMDQSGLSNFAGYHYPGVEPFLKVTYRMPEGQILRCYDEQIDLSSSVEKQ